MTPLALAIAALLLAAAWRAHRYAAALRIAPGRDDEFAFSRPLSVTTIRLDRDGFQLPAGIEAAHTALLAVKLRCTLRGRWQEPYIDMQGDARRGRQYFERGLRGRRYLNVSALLAGPFKTEGSRVELFARGLRWDTEATLTTFAAPRVAGEPALVLAPHPDDAEIAAFGVYADGPAWVVTLTAGERSPTKLSAAGVEEGLRSGWLARLRVWDSLAIPQLGGIPADRCLNLAYPDTQLRAMSADPEREFLLACEPACTRAKLRSLNPLPRYQQADAACRWSALIAELRELVDEQRPAVIVCPHPWLDAHPDHGATTAALVEALRGARHRPTTFLLYSVHSLNASLFPFGESTGCIGLPPGQFPAPIADSLYSHPLDESLRLRKYFAIEAAHDLRSYPHAGLAPAAALLRMALRALAALVSGMPLAPSNYLRRAARPNEMFYVVDEAGLRRLSSASTRA